MPSRCIKVMMVVPSRGSQEASEAILLQQSGQASKVMLYDVSHHRVLLEVRKSRKTHTRSNRLRALKLFKKTLKKHVPVLKSFRSSSLLISSTAQQAKTKSEIMMRAMVDRMVWPHVSKP